MRTGTGFGFRAVIGAAAAVAVALVVATGGSANAADTTTTFNVTSGALTVAAPAATLLGSAAPGNTITAQLGVVTVTDARALLTPTWSATVTSSAFTTGLGTGPETIPTTDVLYWSGPTTATTGSGTTFVPGQPLAANAVAISTGPTAMALTAGTGNNSASWNPTLEVTPPSSAVTGLYTGTVTHSVA
jgi:hypothetical protein